MKTNINFVLSVSLSVCLSVCLSVRLSVRMKQLDRFSRNLVFDYFLEPVDIIQFSVINDKETGTLHEGKYKGKGKGKTIPLQAWTGPEDSRRVRLPDFKTIGT